MKSLGLYFTAKVTSPVVPNEIWVDEYAQFSQSYQKVMPIYPCHICGHESSPHGGEAGRRAHEQTHFQVLHCPTCKTDVTGVENWAMHQVVCASIVKMNKIDLKYVIEEEPSR